ncbi:MAG: hypothetical protein RPR28_07800 [Cycloclasticus sp.]
MLREYKRGDHSAGYIGIRIIVGSYSEYFNFRRYCVMLPQEKINELRAAAHEKHNKLMLEHAEKRKIELAFNSKLKTKRGCFDTGIRGITLAFRQSKRINAKGKLFSPSCCILVSVGSSATGSRRSFGACKYDKAVNQWQLAIEALCDMRGISAPPEWFNFPMTVAQFNSRIKKAARVAQSKCI